MEQGGGVNELDSCGQFMMGGARIATKLRRANRQQRPQAFSARADQMLGKVRNQADRGLHTV